MHVLKSLTQRCRHLLIQVLMMPFMLSHSILYELISAGLLDIVIKPGQVKFIHAKADKVKKRLNVINWCGIWMQLVFTDRCKHRVSFEVFDLPCILI